MFKVNITKVKYINVNRISEKTVIQLVFITKITKPSSADNAGILTNPQRAVTDLDLSLKCCDVPTGAAPIGKIR